MRFPLLLLLLPFLTPLGLGLALPSPPSLLLLLLAPAPRQTPALEAETDRLLFVASLAEFLAARAARSPAGLDWSSDGCSSSPDNPFGFNFRPACYRHDFGYRNYKAQGRFELPGSKAAIDARFRDDLYGQCAPEGAREICELFADVYYRAVVLFGREGEEDAEAEAEVEVEVGEVEAGIERESGSGSGSGSS